MSNSRLVNVLNQKNDNYIFPFFWVRGEKEETLREYMKVIDESNIKAVCVESRPHPDFCGPGWWHDMDIILDEARHRDMKVWILDDSHFPTGFANGAVEKAPEALCRQSICCRKYACKGGETLYLEEDELAHPSELQPTGLEAYIRSLNLEEMGEDNEMVAMIKQMYLTKPDIKKYEDDMLLAIYAVDLEKDQRIDLRPCIDGKQLKWTAPEGEWMIYVLHLSRNMGYHRNYINMLQETSCRIQIEAVYEPHYQHYKDDFGKTIAGFFSDEPELGNGRMYDRNAMLGMDIDYPWSDELAGHLNKRLGTDYPFELYLLWENNADPDRTAKIRYTYMDMLTSLVKKDFSEQIGGWCRSHNVKYIGHLIEDNDQHSRTGSSLGHYFRGLAGQDMAGIDDIGGQVLPQGEDLNLDDGVFQFRDGEFYHYMLGKLANSAAALEPLKNGNSMCEIFGNYGWGEGVRLEKYLLDHFMVRGINHFVPHAFSAADYPDPDCPPHFYAHGNNPQYRHFGMLMKYANRVCELISGGKHIAPVAVLYHAEGEWTGKYMDSHKPAHVLCDAQIDYDFVPQDVFRNREEYHTAISNGVLKVNTQEYKAFIVPRMQFVTEPFARAVEQMVREGVKVYFLEGYPQGICDVSEKEEENLLHGMRNAKMLSLGELEEVMNKDGIPELRLEPENTRIRYYHYEQEDGMGVLLFVNEGTEKYQGTVRFPDKRTAYGYDAWDNCLTEMDYDGERFSLELEPLKSIIVALGSSPELVQDSLLPKYEDGEKEEIHMEGTWKRSICRSLDYPDFKDSKEIMLPDTLAQEMPEFSGFVRYENTFYIAEEGRYALEITDAYEGVEVFVNGKSLGIQVVPVYRYDLSGAVKAGENELVIEVATTLERENAKNLIKMGMGAEPTALSGITGEVRIYRSVG